GAGADRGGAPGPPGGAGAGRARAVYGAAGLTQLPPRPATPVRAAASATASATRWAPSGSRTPGPMWSAVKLSSGTASAMARAAAIFISSLMSRARQARAPVKRPGKQRTLLIWLG